MNTQNLNTADQNFINNIIEQMKNECTREGDPAPVIVWTGGILVDQGVRRYEVKITEPDFNTYTTGWTNGRTEQGFTNFVEA